MQGVPVAVQRSEQQVRAEIERARDQLAGSVDELADRLAPKRLTAQAQEFAREKATSSTGRAVAIGVVVVLSLIVVRNLRKSRR